MALMPVLLTAVTACDARVSPGLTGPVGPRPTTCQGVAVAPSDDFHQVMDSHPPGTTFCVLAGVHRLTTPLTPRRGDTLVGEEGAVLSGSKVLTTWRESGGVWSTTGFLPDSPGDHGECLESAPACAQAEDVFIDKLRLRRVSSPSELTTGTVLVSYGDKIIMIKDDPRLHLVEQAVAPGLVRSTEDHVTVENLVLEQAANEAQVGAIESRQVKPYNSRIAGSGWRIINNQVRLNHGVGIGFGDATTVTGNLIHDQGQLGFGAWGKGSSVTNNEISFNGASGYSSEWEAGGSKSWLTERSAISHNYVHHNMGPGLWSDGGNVDTSYTYNKIAENWGAGIQYEISYDATITNNEISGNGRVHKGWAWEAGIQIQSSGGIHLLEIADNVVTGGANGIALIDSGGRTKERPAPHGPHIVQNVWVHDNIITMAGQGITGAVDDTGDPGIYTTNNNRFDNNVYYLDSMTGPHFSWAGADTGWRRWRGSGQGNDINGRAEPAGR